MDIRSNEPYSLIVNALEHSYPSLRENTSSEILIIGAGVTAALTAFKLLNEGKKVILVDKRDVCNGSTAASTSILQYEIDVPLHQLIEKVGLTVAVSSYRDCKDAIYRLKEIVDHIKSDCGFSYQKSIYFTNTKKDISFLQKEFEARKEHGFAVRWLESADLEKIGLKAYAAIESATSARLDIYKFTNDLLGYLSKKGIRIYDRTKISDIKPSHEGMKAITDKGYTIEVKDIVHCTGYESTETLQKEVVNLKSTFALVSEAYENMPEAFKDRLYWNTDSPYLYFRSTSDGRIMMGGGDEDFKNAKQRDALLPKKENKLSKAFKECFPNVPFVADYSWAGTFGETQDGLPYFGKQNPEDKEHYILGFGGNGITFSVMGMDAIMASLEGTPHPYLEYYKFDRR